MTNFVYINNMLKKSPLSYDRVLQGGDYRKL